MQEALQEVASNPLLDFRVEVILMGLSLSLAHDTISPIAWMYFTLPSEKN